MTFQLNAEGAKAVRQRLRRSRSAGGSGQQAPGKPFPCSRSKAVQCAAKFNDIKAQ